jgi:hypothetical protein
LSETASPKLDEERTFMSRERKREKGDAVDKTMDRADTTQKRQEGSEEREASGQSRSKHELRMSVAC